MMISPSTAATASRTPMGVMLPLASAVSGSALRWQRHTQSRSVECRQLSWLPSMHGMQVLTTSPG